MNDIERVAAAVPKGKENAIHLNDLAAQLNMHPTKVKRCINAARQQGEFILSDLCGYWRSETKEEMRCFVRMMKKQAISRLKAIKAINTNLKKFDGQMSLADAHSKDVKNE